MNLPDSQLDSIRTRITTLVDACLASGPDQPDDTEQSRLRQAFTQLTEVMARLDADAATGQVEPGEITEIGEYALRLAENLAASPGCSGSQPQRLELAGLTIGLALWIARLGGRIDTLEPVVDAIALQANAIRDPHRLEVLCEQIHRIVPAVSPLISQDIEKINPGRPWRVLLLNQGIVATRSHNTRLMEQAFAELTRYLPDDAARFFSEGMQQMDALDYPEPVRQVMQKYHRQWTRDRSLH
jgi:hypothetical protein